MLVDVVFEVLAVGDNRVRGGHDAGCLVDAAGGLRGQVDGGFLRLVDGFAVALQEGGEVVVLEAILEVIVRIPTGYEFQRLDAAGHLFHVFDLQGVAETVQEGSVLKAALCGAFPADLVGPDDGTAREGGRHLHALRSGEGGFLAEVDEELVHRRPVGEADELHPDVEVAGLLGLGGNMGHAFGPVVGPDGLRVEAESREERGGKDRHLFHIGYKYTYSMP